MFGLLCSAALQLFVYVSKYMYISKIMPVWVCDVSAYLIWITGMHTTGTFTKQSHWSKRTRQ